MKGSLLSHILDQPIDKLVRISKPIPNREALRLYREILKFSNEFDWNNEKGQQWQKILRISARKEFDLAKNEKDPFYILKMIVTSRQAISETRDRINAQLHSFNSKLNQKQ